jgi:signal transduction histidine kinase
MKQKQASQREASPSWLSIWMTIATVFGLLLKAGFLFLQRVSLSSGSDQYERWRDRLLRDRLQLIVRIALFVTLITLGIEFVTAGFSISRRVALYGAVALSLYICYSLRKTSLGRSRPGLVFLGICWSITLIPGLEHWLERSDLPNLNLWTLTFLVNVLLVPVYWSLHVLSQLGVIAFYAGMEWLNPNYPATAGQFLQQILYLFWVGFICDLSVYLHEQFQRKEIESKHTQRLPATLRSLLRSEPHDEPTSSLRLTRNGRPGNWQQRCDRYLQQINTSLSAYIATAKKQSRQRYTSDLHVVVQKTIVQIDSLLSQQHAILTNAVSPTLPPVDAAPEQLQFVLENLVNDALERNSEEIHITVSAEVVAATDTQPFSMVRCTVQDDGVAVQSDREIAEDLIDQEADTVLEWQIGVSLSEPIIQSQGGAIGIISNQEIGTTVWFTLAIATSHHSSLDLTTTENGF